MSYIGNNPKWRSGTFTPQSTQPVNPVTGQTYFDDGTNLPAGIYVYDGVNWVSVGSGSGVLNFYETGNADSSSTSDFTTGNNTSFDGGGVLQGVFDKSTTSADLISGTSVFKLTLNATPSNSDNDYVASEAIDIPQGYRGRQLEITLQYKYDGADSDLKWVVLDETNGNVLVEDLLPSADRSNDVADARKILFFCPNDCQQLKIGPQVITHSTGSEEFIWDDVVVTPNLNSSFQKTNLEDWQSFTPVASAGFGTITNARGQFRRVGDSLEVECSFSAGTVAASTAAIELPASLSLDINKIGGQTRNRLGSANRLNGSDNVFDNSNGFVIFSDNTDTTNLFIAYRALNDTTVRKDNVNAFFISGDSVIIKYTVPIEGWSADTEFFVNTATGTENQFTARFTTSTTSAVTQENVPNLFSSVTRDGAGLSSVTAVFGSGVSFTVPPIVKLYAENDGAKVTAKDVSVTTTGFTFQQANASDSGVNSDQEFTVEVINSGVDYKNPSATAAIELQNIQTGRFDTHAGYGSTNTKIPYFTNQRELSDEGIVTVENDSTNGFSITAVRNCVVTFSFYSRGSSMNIGISLNSNQLTTDIFNINEENICALDSVASGLTGCSCSVRLAPGDVLRPHTNSAAVTSNQSGITFKASISE